jgi:hypothetical protein
MRGININMNVTFSKALSALTLILGALLSLIHCDNQYFSIAVPVVMVIVTGQNLGSAIVKSKCKNYGNT